MYVHLIKLTDTEINFILWQIQPIKKLSFWESNLCLLDKNIFRKISVNILEIFKEDFFPEIIATLHILTNILVFQNFETFS
jgi:hypothetical protein